MIEKIDSPLPLSVSVNCLEVVAAVDYNQGGKAVPLSPDEENVLDLGHVSLFKLALFNVM